MFLQKYDIILQEIK